MPGCEGLQGEWQHFQAGHLTLWRGSESQTFFHALSITPPVSWRCSGGVGVPGCESTGEARGISRPTNNGHLERGERCAMGG